MQKSQGSPRSCFGAMIGEWFVNKDKLFFFTFIGEFVAGAIFLLVLAVLGIGLDWPGHEHALLLISPEKVFAVALYVLLLLMSAALFSASALSSLRSYFFPTATAVYLAFFIFLAGTWTFTESHVLCACCDNTLFLRFLSYLSFYLIPPAFLLFAREFCHCGKKVFEILAALFLVSFAVCLVWTMTHRFELPPILPLFHLLLGISMVFSLVASIHDIVQGKNSDAKFLLVGIVVLMVFAAIDLGRFYLAPTENFAFALSIGFLIFAFILGGGVLRKMLGALSQARDIQGVFAETPAGLGQILLENNTFYLVYVNDEYFNMLGYARQSDRPEKIALDTFFSPDDDIAQKLRDGIASGSEIFEVEAQQCTLTGERRWVLLRCRYNSTVRLITFAGFDLTEKKASAEQLRMSEEAFRIAAQTTGKHIMRCDIATRAFSSYGNNGDFDKTLASCATLSEALDAFGVVDPASRKVFDELSLRAQKGLSNGSGTIRREKNGGTYWYRVDYSLVFGDDGKPGYVVIVFSDVSLQQERERALKKRSEIDPLTGVLNRAGFEAAVGRILDQSPAGIHHAFIMFDLDGFKKLNDTQGHAAGDKALSESMKRLHAAIREGDVIGRIGGDEFAVCLTGMDSRDAIVKAAQRINQLLQQSDSDAPPLAASLGIALYPQDGAISDELYLAADKAMYRAKARGGNCYVFAQDEKSA
ncbi:MAG: diguanylate cyclase [Raoultibacter sp.]